MEQPQPENTSFIQGVINGIDEQIQKKYVQKIQEIINSENFASLSIDEQVAVLQRQKDQLNLYELNNQESDPMVSPDLPESISMNFHSYSPFILDPQKLTERAFNTLSPLELINKLMNLVQITDPALISKHTLNLIAMDDPDRLYKQYVVDQITKGREISRDIHYSLIFILIQLHVYVSTLITNIPNLQLKQKEISRIRALQVKNALELLIVRYNSADPAWNLIGEENGVRKIKAVKSVILNLISLFDIPVDIDSHVYQSRARQTKSIEKGPRSNQKASKSSSTVKKTSSTNPLSSPKLPLPPKKSESVRSINAISIKRITDKGIFQSMAGLSQLIKWDRGKTSFVQPATKGIYRLENVDSKDYQFDIERQAKRDQEKLQEKTDGDETATNALKKIQQLPTITIPDLQITVMDLLEITNPQEILVKFDRLFEELISFALDFSQQLSEFAYYAKFNLSENQFGSPLTAKTNADSMEFISSEVGKFINYSSINLAQPLFIIESNTRLTSFVSKSGFGKSICTLSLLPEETRVIHVKSSEIVKEIREKSQSILDSQAKNVKDEFNTQLDKERSQSQSIAKEYSDYQNADQAASQGQTASQAQTAASQQSSSQSKGSNLGGGVNANLTASGIPIGINASAGLHNDNQKNASKDQSTSVNNSQHQDLSENLSMGTSNALNINREHSSNVLENTVKNHCQEVSSKRDVNITETTKKSVETLNEKGSVQEISNRNTSKAMNIVFRQNLQEFLIYHHLVDLKIIYTNGEIFEKYPLSAIDVLLDKYIQQDETVYKDLLRDLAILACRVVDYKNRVIEMQDPDMENSVFLKKINYAEYLKENPQYPLYYDDKVNLKKFAHIPGVVLSCFTQILKDPGYRAYITLSETNAMDEYRTRETELKLEAHAQQVMSSKNFNKNQASNRKFVETLTDVQMATDARFKLLKKDREIIDKIFTVDYANRKTLDTDDDINIHLTK